jgi:hypothetical protein
MNNGTHHLEHTVTKKFLNFTKEYAASSFSLPFLFGQINEDSVAQGIVDPTWL